MTDNGSCYRSRMFRTTCKRLGLRQIFTRPYTPRTNGKAERFIQTALREWHTHMRRSRGFAPAALHGQADRRRSRDIASDRQPHPAQARPEPARRTGANRTVYKEGQPVCCTEARRPPQRRARNATSVAVFFLQSLDRVAYVRIKSHAAGAEMGKDSLARVPAPQSWPLRVFRRPVFSGQDTSQARNPLVSELPPPLHDEIPASRRGVLLTWASSEPAKVIAIVGGFVILLALSIITTNEGLLSLDFVLSIVGIFAGLVILIPKKRRSLGKNLTLASLASVVLTLFAKTFSSPIAGSAGSSRRRPIARS
jgi:hypothetical protein